MIITLDDFGLNRKVNREIHTWTRTKRVDCVSLLANSPATNEALRLYKNNKHRQYKLGLHLNLIEGKPLCKKNKVPSLVDSNGYFYATPLFIFRLFLGLIKKEDVMKELQKQYNVLAEAHIQCAHINSHQNIHVFHFLYACVEEFAKENKIKYVRQVSTVKNRLRKFPLKYVLFVFLYAVSSLLFPSYGYKPTSFVETTFHPGTTFD